MKNHEIGKDNPKVNSDLPKNSSLKVQVIEIANVLRSKFQKNPKPKYWIYLLICISVVIFPGPFKYFAEFLVKLSPEFVGFCCIISIRHFLF